MNNAEFLREFGRILMRPTTKSTALDLYEAYLGYCANNLDKFCQLSPRDQLPIVYLFANIRDGVCSPSEVREEDMASFHPEKGFQSPPIERREFQKYLDFFRLVVNGVKQMFMRFGEECVEDCCENLRRGSEDNRGEPTMEDVYACFCDEMGLRLYEAWKDECDAWYDLIGEEKALEWFDEGARVWLDKRLCNNKAH